MSPCLSHTAFALADTYDSLSPQSSFKRKSFNQTMGDVKYPAACEWYGFVCRRKVRSEGEGRLPSRLRPKPWKPSAPLPSSPLFSSGCSATTNNNFLLLRRTNRIHFFHLYAKKVNRLRRGVCLLIGQEAVTSVSGEDYAGKRAFQRATHRDELRMAYSRVSYPACTVACCSDTGGKNGEVAKANCIPVPITKLWHWPDLGYLLYLKPYIYTIVLAKNKERYGWITECAFTYNHVA